MRTQAKKPSSRQAFESVFEEQARRFSAFDLLGLTPEVTSPSSSQGSQDTSSKWSGDTVPAAGSNADRGQAFGSDSQREVPGPDRQALAQRSDSHSQELRPDSQAEGLRPDTIEEENLRSQAQALGSDSQREVPGPDRRALEQRSDSHSQELRPDNRREDLIPCHEVQEHRLNSTAQGQTLDPQQGQTLHGQFLGPTVRSSLAQTGASKRLAKLGPDRQRLDTLQSADAILLAPLQWDVWLALQNVEAAGQITSYRQIAKGTKSTIDGVRKAVRVIQKERGIITKETVRTAEEQGFRVTLNHDVLFRRGTLNEAKAVLKRGLALGLTTDRQTQVLRSDGLRMSVCKNINIKQTDVAQLLRISPPDWRIREQTLIQIADVLSEMTAIEFRLSLVHLIEQAKNSKEPIRNPNAWIKAAFEKNGGPLVTEREIEARFEQYPLRREAQRSRMVGEQNNEDFELLRRYIACKPEERAEIDRMAGEKAAQLLKVVSEDKHTGVIEEARLETVREFFSKKP